MRFFKPLIFVSILLCQQMIVAGDIHTLAAQVEKITGVDAKSAEQIRDIIKQIEGLAGTALETEWIAWIINTKDYANHLEEKKYMDFAALQAQADAITTVNTTSLNRIENIIRQAETFPANTQDAKWLANKKLYIANSRKGGGKPPIPPKPKAAAAAAAAAANAGAAPAATSADGSKEAYAQAMFAFYNAIKASDVKNAEAELAKFNGYLKADATNNAKISEVQTYLRTQKLLDADQTLLAGAAVARKHGMGMRNRLGKAARMQMMLDSLKAGGDKAAMAIKMATMRAAGDLTHGPRGGGFGGKGHGHHRHGWRPMCGPKGSSGSGKGHGHGHCRKK